MEAIAMAKNKELNPSILSLTIDGVFKMYFEEPRNLPELRRFLKAHLELSDDDLTTIDVLNPGLPKDNIGDKAFTVDLLLKTKTGNDIHVEMQTSSHANFKERIQLYNSRKAGQQVKIGKDYSSVKRTISLVVVDFNVFEDESDYHEIIMMRRKNGEVFTNVQEINIISLPQLKSAKTNDRNKYLCCKLFKVQTKEELEMLAKESEEMAEATEKLRRISEDERAQAYALSRDNAEFARAMHEHDMRERLKRDIEEELKQGIEQGVDVGKIEIAKKLFARGMSIEDVSEVTGLTIERLTLLGLMA